jgi:hypothetical protein
MFPLRGISQTGSRCLHFSPTGGRSELDFGDRDDGPGRS